jgi:heat shock protein HslJ
MNRIFTLLLTFVYIMACNTVKKDDNNQQLNRIWMLVEFEQFTKEDLTKNQAYLDLTKPENAASKMGCNNLSFQYKIVSNSEIQFNDGIATKMYCDDMQLETDFSKEITLISNYSLDGHHLTLTSSDGKKMVFVAQDWD